VNGPSRHSLTDKPAVTVLHWPADRARVDDLRRLGVPRLLLVEGDGSPPIATDHLEDWIRVPAAEVDVEARIEQLRHRAGQPVPMPMIDDHDVLWRGDRWAGLAPIEARLIRALLQEHGTVVPRSTLMQVGWEGAERARNILDVHILRLRRRLAPLGLTIHTVRSRGYLLAIEPNG
jgi:hypothetical protein